MCSSDLAVLPAELRTTGIAVLTTVVSLCRLVASVAFGALWTWSGVQMASLLFAVGLVAALAISVPVLVRMYGESNLEPSLTI